MTNKKFLLKVTLFIIAIIPFILIKINFPLWIYSIALLILLFLFTNNNAEINNDIFKFNSFEIKKQNVFIFIGKIIIIGLFIFLGQYFLYKNYKILGYTSYFFAYLQTLFLFKVARKERTINDILVNKIIVKLEKNIKILIRILILCLILYFIYLSLNYAINNEYKKFLLFLILSLPLLYLLKDIFNEKNDYENKLIEIILAFMIFGVALFLRVYRLLEIPPGIINDLTVVISVFDQAKQGISLPMYLPGVYSMATLNAKVFGFLAKLLNFDINIYTVKLGSAILGTINIIFLYLLIREIFTKRIAIFSAIILTFMSQHLLFSRSGEAMALTLASTTASFYMYFLAIRKGKILLMILSGVLLGLTIYFYTPGRAVPFIYIIYWTFFLILNLNTKIVRENVYYLCKMNFILIISSFIVFIPLLDYIIKYPNAYFERIKQFNLIGHFFCNKNGIENMLAQFSIYFKFFFSEGCEWGLYNLTNQPGFDYITNMLFILGFAFLMLNLKQFNNLFVICWFFIGILIGILSGTATLYPARIILIYPVVAIISAIGIDIILNRYNFKSYFKV